MSNGFEAVLFDMDGTIADTTIYHNRAWIEFAQVHLGEVLGEGDPRFIPGRTHDIIPSILGRPVSQQEIARLHDDKELRFQALASGMIRPLAGLREYLVVLREKGLATGLVTNAPRMNIDFTLRELDLVGFFDVALGAEDVVNGKPDPAPFSEACRRLGVKPPKALVHEDSDLGIISAVLAGCPVAAVLSGMSRKAALQLGAQWTFDDYVEWLELFRRIG